MIDSSAAYGLYNPAFTEDIGMSSINRMYPAGGNTEDFRIAGTDFSNIDIQHRLMTDTAEFKNKQKNKNILSGILIGACVLGLGALGYKFGKPLFKNIGKLFKKGGPTRAWNKLTKLPAQALKFIKNIPSKISKLFK